MKSALVGYSGFVGSNLLAKGEFTHIFNSKNIDEAYGLNPDILYYAGIRAEKYLANNDPEKDYENILIAQENIKKINPKKVVLISTIDVYPRAIDVDEESSIILTDKKDYGSNRLRLELWLRKNYDNYSIIRLPALFGKNIKKNFIYDCLKIIPHLLTIDKLKELSLINNEMMNYYHQFNDNFYEVNILNKTEKEQLLSILKELKFDARNFTNSINEYQFYPLQRLYDDIQIVLDNDINLINFAVEPIRIDELYRYIYQEEFDNIISDEPLLYDFKTINYKLFNGSNGYILNKKEVSREIKEFIDNYEK